MIETQFVTFKLAKQLKRFGYSDKCIAYFGKDGTFYPMGTVVGPDTIHFGIFNPKYQYLDGLEIMYAAPLWQQVTEWLRNAHRLMVVPDAISLDTYSVKVTFIGGYANVDEYGVERGQHFTYAQALEIGIDEALKKLEANVTVKKS